MLKVAGDGTVTVCEDGDDDRDRVAVNRDFLLHALDAGARDQLILELGAPTAPLAIRRTDTEDTFSILDAGHPPGRLDGQACRRVPAIFGGATIFCHRAVAGIGSWRR